MAESAAPPATNNGREGNVEQEESYLFREKDQVFEWINLLVPTASSHPDSDWTNKAEEALASIRAILDKYLECPTLLDPSLQEMVDTLVGQVKQQLQSATTANENETNITAAIQYPLTALYAISKVRGYKRVNKFLSHLVEDVELIWDALQSWKTHNVQCWEPVYSLWHWMGVLSLVPFHSKVVSGDEGFVERVVTAAKAEIANQTGPVQEAAATCMASWLSRPDVDLTVFSSWAIQVVQDHVQIKETAVSRKHKSLNLVLGVLQVSTKILKHSTVSRQLLIDQLVEPLWDPLYHLANDSTASSNLLLRRYLVKWYTRTSCTYFPPSRTLAPWRYERGRRMLLMDQLDKQTQQKSASSEVVDTINNGSKSSNGGATESDGHSPDELFFVPDHVEDAMGCIIDNLGHSSTIVRWSAAKGIGRVTERLPKLCALDVLEAVLEFFDNPEKDHCWHGACLALAELARKGLLLPTSLPKVVQKIIQAIHYDVQRGHSSVGSNVRDAACYAFWAFARSYSPSVLRFHLDKLAEAVVLTSLFDREVNCRRAASAAFQEAVGRQGMASFPNGIFVITTADFYSLGNRAEAYTNIATEIATLEEYRHAIMEHLCKRKLFHWDPAIRQLSSQGLASVANLDVDYVGKNVLPALLDQSLDSKNLHVRHGASLGVAELVRVLGAGGLEACLSEEAMAKTLDLVNQIEKRRLYRGRGGEIMRTAVCRLVECIAEVRIPLNVKNQVGMLDSVDASIPHPNEEIQQCACDALEKLLANYFPVSEKGPTDRLRTRVLEKFLKQVRSSKNPAATRGYALALGHLPGKLLAPTGASLDLVINALSAIAHPRAKVDGEGDAETRRNAVRSMALVVKNVLHASREQDRKHPIADITMDQCSQVIRALFRSMEDYNVDRRGDVGSWCRMAAMDGLVSLVVLCDEMPDSKKPLFGGLSETKLVGSLVKQLTEKLDGVRLHAGVCLQKVLLREAVSCPEIVGRKALIQSLQLKGCSIDYDWAEAKSVFCRAMAAAIIHDEAGIFPYYDHVIAGIIVSVGGKAEAAYATNALLNHTQEAKGTQMMRRLACCLLGLFEKNPGVGRVTLPLLRTIDKLLSRGCLADVLEDEDTFASPLLNHMKTERKGCRDIHRLFALADVAAALSNGLPQGEEETSVLFLCGMLEHSYPKVRSHVAEVLYLAIQEKPKMASKAAATIVLETPWGSELTKDEVKQFSLEVKKSLGFVERPT